MDKKAEKAKQDLAEDLLREFAYLEGSRSNWESHWEEIAQRMLPMHSRSFTSRGDNTQGDKRNEYIFDSTAVVALNRFAAILDSLLTPRNQTWHRMIPSDKRLQKDRQAKLWFEEFNQALFKYRYAPSANFASQNQMTFKSTGAYGTGSLFVDKMVDRGQKGLRYRNIHLGEIYFKENHQGIVDTFHRKFPMTARQAMQKWGEKCPAKIKEAYKERPDTCVEIIHCVKPRVDIDPRRKDYGSMPFASYYVSLKDKQVIDEGGYSSWPLPISRYELAPGEIYARSPAMDVLPANKTLNEMKKTLLKQGHRAVDPVYLVHDDGVADMFSAVPGAVISGGISADGRSLVGTLPVGNVNIGKELLDDERAVINDAFLVSLFQILTESPQMTATEVLERTKEKGILLAPTIGRQQSEYLGPMIEREADLLMELGLIAPMPQILVEARGDYRIEYDSPLSRAQRAEEASGLMRTLETVLQAVNVTQNPEPLDHLDWDVIIPEISEIQGVPARWMRSMEAVNAIRAGRQDQADAQQMAQIAPGAAAMIKAVNQTQRGA